MHRPHPRDDLPEVIISFDGLAEGWHRPDYGFGALPGVALLLELDGAKRDQSKECIVVITIDPNLIGEGGGHAAAATTSVAAIAVERHVYLMTFLGDAGEVRVGVFQLTFRRAGYALQRCPDFPSRDPTASGRSG
jgi:hypothetical protein